MTDPVSWLQIEKGWNVVSADGVLVGKVGEVTGGSQRDEIFDVKGFKVPVWLTPRLDSTRG